MWWYMTVPLPNGKFWLVSYSRSVISSITGPKERIFRQAEVVPSSVNRMAWHAKNGCHSMVSKQVSASLDVSFAWLYS